MSSRERLDSERPASGSGLAGILAAGGLLGGLLASTCCVLPVGLAALGLGGMSLGFASVFFPYSREILLAATFVTGVGLFLTYRKRADGTACRIDARKGVAAALLVKGTLWVAAAVIGGVAAFDWL